MVKALEIWLKESGSKGEHSLTGAVCWKHMRVAKSIDVILTFPAPTRRIRTEEGGPSEPTNRQPMSSASSANLAVALLLSLEYFTSNSCLPSWTPRPSIRSARSFGSPYAVNWWGRGLINHSIVWIYKLRSASVEETARFGPVNKLWILAKRSWGVMKWRLGTARCRAMFQSHFEG